MPRRISTVFLVFLRLGCTSFGGPIAHLGYFEKEFVEHRQWCSSATFAELIALAQSLPGPSSSQVGFAIGLLRAGWLGGIAAWAGFTLPSALLMFAFAYGRSILAKIAAAHLLHALQLVAVAVVAQAVLTMRNSLAPDRPRTAIALTATALALFLSPAYSTLGAITFGAGAGLLFCRSVPNAFPAGNQELIISKNAATLAASLFLMLLLLAVLVPAVEATPLGVFSAFYRSGVLVFGGGHVVLPLLENTVVSRGWVTEQAFLSGYGAAQALPGPLFTFAVYLGASIGPNLHPSLNALLALLGIFLPGLLAIAAALPFWNFWRSRPAIRAAFQGINASVVGVLLAALFHPLWTSTVHSSLDFFIALLAFALLALWKLQPWIVVIGTAVASLLLKHS